MVKHLLFLLIVLSSLMACSKRKLAITDPYLPPITDTGANTMGAIINGRIMVPYQDFILNSPIDVSIRKRSENNSIEYFIWFYNSHTNDRLHFKAAFNADLVNMPNKTYPIGFYNNKYFESNGNIKLDTVQVEFVNGNISKEDFICLPEKGYVGEFTIIKADKDKKIIAGTFWFNAISLTGQVVEVRDGRFDLRYKE